MCGRSSSISERCDHRSVRGGSLVLVWAMCPNGFQPGLRVTDLPRMAITAAQESLVIVTLKISGRLDALEAPTLRSTLDQYVEDGVAGIVVDLSAVTFVDSAGLAALVKGMKDTQRAGGTFQLVQPQSEDAMRVFKLTRFDHVFDMVASVEEAQQSD